MDNGLLRKVFLMKPGFGAVSLFSYTSGILFLLSCLCILENEILRALSPEAQVKIDDVE